VPFAIDPTRGSLLSLLIQGKTIEERIQDGGAVGYVIIALGSIGILLALIRMLDLAMVGSKVAAQAKNATPDTGNPLGRILKVYQDNQSVDVETLELKLGEAILGETPKINRGIAIVQVISVVSPLLGLLGTVIGMILTFQAITLFGTGDPKTMAGGISTALMTTVLGLCAAIPTVLMHAVVSGRAKSVIHVLEEQSAGIIAKHAEQSGKSLG
jgi:biopolymer transport protein ExbB